MRTAIYVRVSTSRQAQAQTIEQQLDRLRTRMQEQGEDIVSDTIFRDDGYSEATLNRPGLDRLRDAVRAGAVGRVLVTDPDRLARNYMQLMVFLEELEHHGGHGRVSGPANGTRSTGSASVADPGRRGGVRAHLDCRTHATGTPDEAARRMSFALDQSYLRLPLRLCAFWDSRLGWERVHKSSNGAGR